MKTDELLSILSVSRNGLTMRELKSLIMSIREMNFTRLNCKTDNFKTIEQSLYHKLNYLLKKGYINKTRDRNIHYQPYRYSISDNGISYLATSTELELVKKTIQLLS
jgi:DNA-binding PadR family transcriptional regulator